jgi:transmembrane sensor
MANLNLAAAIETEAAEWTVRSDRGLTAAERAALEAWVAADIRHAGAFAKTQAMWVQVDRAQIFRHTQLVSEGWGVRKWTGMRWRAASFAALVILAGASLLEWRSYAGSHLATEIGEVRHVHLADGSTVVLNTNSRIVVRYSKGARVVRVDAGEAFFDVAHDPVRPFIVEAGAVHSRDVGTAFDVRRGPESEVTVAVLRGVVDVWREARIPEPALRLGAGLRTLVVPEAAPVATSLSEAQVAQLTAWQDGYIDLQGETLQEAAADFNRYNQQIVRIEDATLAGKHVVGRFHARDPMSFAHAAALTLNAEVRADGNQIVLNQRSIR